MKRTLCLLTLLLIAFIGAGQTITYTGSLCAGGSLTLSVNGAPAGATYQWRDTVSDNIISNQPTANVSAAGIYDVVLNMNGVLDTLDAVTIAIKPAPVADFTFTNNNTCSGTPMAFTSLVSVGTAPFTYAWDFGDGSPINALQNPTHSFTSLGCGTVTFNVRLTVTDANGCVSTLVQKTIQVKQAPDVRLSDADIFTPFSNCDNSPTPANPNFTLTVNNVSVGNCITAGSYVLNWGDGSPVVNNPTFPLTHTYTQLGAFNLTLTATSNNGCIYTKTYVVANQSNPAGGLGTLGSTTGLCAPFNVPFIISNWQNNSPGTKYLLEFGDGAFVLLNHPLTSDTVYHNYTSTSCPSSTTFTATLQVINACDSTPYTAGNIQIRIKPAAAFIASPTACANTSVCFTNTTAAGYTGSNCNTISAWVWDFGDGSPNSTAPSPCHTYTTPGIYTVTLTASNPCGPSSFTKTICITGAPTSLFSLDKSGGCAPQTINATNTSAPGSACANPTYKWSVTYSATNCGTGSSWVFAGGTVDTSTNPSFTFNNPGTYTINLAVTNACTTVNSTQTVVITAPPKITLPTIPNACGSVTLNPSVGATINNCSGGALSYLWTFPGGVTSTAADPGPITFSTVGTNTITLAVTNDCGTMTATKSFNIASAPDVTVPAALSLCAGTTTGALNFISSLPNTSFAWTNDNTSIGLAGSGSGNIASFAVQNPGTVPVIATISITPSNNGCQGAAQSFTITANPKPATPVAASPVAYCLNAAAAPLTATAAAGHTLTWYTDATLTNGSAVAPTPLTTVAATTNYFVTQSAGGCASAATQVVVNVLPSITGNSIGADQTICTGNAAATLTGTATVGGGNGVYLYQWQSSTDGGANWSAITGATNPLYNPGAVNITTLYRRSIGSGACVDNFSNVVTITVQGALSNFDIVGVPAICAGATPNALDGQTPSGSGSTSTFQWQSSPDGNMWTDIAGAVNEDFQPPALTVSTYYRRTVTNGSCTAASSTVLITVNATPVINAVNDLFYCNNTLSPTINFTGTPAANVVYNWTNSNAAIGLVASGTGAIPSFTTTNNNLLKTPESGRIDVTPYNTANSLNCVGSPVFFNITILPAIAVQAINDTVVCSGATVSSFTPVHNAGAVQGAAVSYTWTVTGSGIDLTNGSGNSIPSFTTANGGTTDLIATITVTPQYSFGGQTCAGTPATYRITVKPATPIANAGPDALLCAAPTYTMQGSPTGNAAGLWTQVSGPGAIINNAALPNTVITGLQPANTYVFEWTITGYNACPATTDQMTIQVFPALVNTIDATPQTICFSQTINITGAAPTGGNGNYNYQWQYSADGTTWTNIVGQTSQNLIFTPTQSGFVRRSIASQPCTSESLSTTITVQPAVSNNAISADQSICINTQPAPINGAQPTGANGIFLYQWEQSSDGGATWAAIAGATAQNYAPPILTATTVYRRMVSSTLCTGPQSSISNRVTITVNPDAEALFTYATDTACAPFRITTSVIFLQDLPAKNGAYEWYANGTLIGTGASFPGYTIANSHDSVLIKLKALSRFGCVNDSMEHWFFTVMEPQPDFALSTNTGCGPLQVQVTNNTANASLFRFYWTFGDGQTSTAVQPGTIVLPPSPFFTDTTYIITLHAISPCDTITLSKSVLVKSKPKSLFTPDKTVGCSPLTVTFNNTSLGSADLYTWNFGDGTTAVANTADTIAHSFVTGVLDTFYISLRAENICGADSLQYAVVVSPNKIFLDFAVNGNEQAGCAPHTVRFINNTRGATSFRWDFGDGNILSTTRNIDTVTHTYQQAGNFSVRLFATNGCSDTSTTELISVYPTPKAAFAASAYIVCIGDSVRFTNASDSATTYLWNFGDGVTSTLVSPVHQYRATGIYTVTLKSFRTAISGITCSDSVSQQVSVVNTRGGWFDATDTLSACAPLTVTFTNRNMPATSAVWDFGDGTTGTGNVVTHTYAAAGTYIVTLTVVAPQGCTYVTTRTIRVLGPSGTLQYTTGFLCNDGAARFQVAAANTDSVLWNFGDGTTSITTGNVVFHTYANGGFYIPSATLLSNAGCRILLQGSDTIKVDKIEAGFTAVQQQTCGFTDVAFTDTTKAYYGSVISSWTFGDGNTGMGNIVSNTYTASGDYPVQLIAASAISGCADTLVKNLRVKVNDKPKAAIIAGTTGCTNSATVFRSGIQAIDSVSFINWSVSNGARSSGPIFTYSFAQPGTYTVQLIVGTVAGCFDTAMHTITINASPIITAGADELLCLGGSAQLQASGAPQFSWAPLQGLSCTACANPIAAPAVTTTYIVRGTNAAGCTDDDTVLVTVIQPMNLQVSPNDSICIGQSTVLQASGAASYVWSPAAGLSSTAISNPVASPTVTTIYRVVGYDGFNCFTDTAFVTVAIGQYPVISLGPDVTLATGTLHPLATSVQNGPIRSWLWLPATDLSCTTCPLPIANIKKDITYIVRGTTAYGCSDTDTISIRVFCENTQLFIPNAFSPDGDGVNDILMVRGKGIAAVKTFRIFNRWGEVVFEKSSFAPNDPAHGWNGKVRGVVGGPDVYVYTAEVICENGTTYTYQGNVSVIR